MSTLLKIQRIYGGSRASKYQTQTLNGDQSDRFDHSQFIVSGAFINYRENKVNTKIISQIFNSLYHREYFCCDPFIYKYILRAPFASKLVSEHLSFPYWESCC